MDPYFGCCRMKRRKISPLSKFDFASGRIDTSASTLSSGSTLDCCSSSVLVPTSYQDAFHTLSSPNHPLVFDEPDPTTYSSCSPLPSDLYSPDFVLSPTAATSGLYPFTYEPTAFATYSPTFPSHAQANACSSAIDCCELPCTADCESDDCSSCDEAEQCCEPCTEDISCTTTSHCYDPDCFSYDSLTTTPNYSVTTTPIQTYPQTPIDSFVNPRQLMLDCHWEDSSGHHCETSHADFSSLSQHILQDHIKTQRVLPCQWNDCSNAVNVDDFTTHIWQDHHPLYEAPDPFVCLWHACGQCFASTEDLDAHMKSAHYQVNCRWDGCEQATNSEYALRAHIERKHLAGAFGWKSRESTPTTISATTPRSPPEKIIFGQRGAKEVVSDWHVAVKDLTSSVITEASKTSTNAGDKTCKWLTNGAICGQIHPNGNELQQHIERAHLPELRMASTSASPPVNTCRWQGCKTQTVFSERSKLARHLYTHTKFMVGSCRFCQKEFSNQNQLNDHERTHTKEKPFACDKCAFRASNKASLTTHMRTHTGEKPLKCDKCAYTCGDPSNMSKHRKTHEAPIYQCDQCSKSFCRMATLRRHQLSHA